MDALNVSEPDLLFDAARQGRLPLATLIDRAQALAGAGQTKTAAALYETWVNGTNSPMQHVACFNWGTLLSSLGDNAAAEAAYERALAQHAAFHPARLNYGHLLERRGQHDAALVQWRQVVD